jgi:hypothetical protein
MAALALAVAAVIYGGLADAQAFRAHLQSLGSVGSVKVLPLLPALTLTDAGALAVPNGYAGIRDIIFAAFGGNKAAQKNLALVMESPSASVFDLAVLQHIAYCAANPDALIRPAAKVAATNGSGTNRKNAILTPTLEEWNAKKAASDKKE